MLARLVVAIHEGGLALSVVEPDALPNGTYLPTVLRAVFRQGDAVRVNTPEPTMRDK